MAAIAMGTSHNRQEIGDHDAGNRRSSDRSDQPHEGSLSSDSFREKRELARILALRAVSNKDLAAFAGLARLSIQAAGYALDLIRGTNSNNPSFVAGAERAFWTAALSSGNSDWVAFGLGDVEGFLDKHRAGIPEGHRSVLRGLLAIDLPRAVRLRERIDEPEVRAVIRDLRGASADLNKLKELAARALNIAADIVNPNSDLRISEATREDLSKALLSGLGGLITKCVPTTDKANAKVVSDGEFSGAQTALNCALDCFNAVALLDPRAAGGFVTTLERFHKKNPLTIETRQILPAP